jgi:hypothetical protein
MLVQKKCIDNVTNICVVLLKRCEIKFKIVLSSEHVYNFLKFMKNAAEVKCCRECVFLTSRIQPEV